MIKFNPIKSILYTKPQKIHGVNPSLTYPLSGKSYDLPRFCSVEMQMARVMNKFAHKDSYYRQYIALSSPKILPEDLKRLESMTIEDTYKRTFWINPKDNKGYHLLDEGRTKDGKQKLRILDEQGVFVKNAEVKPKTIILSDIARDSFSVISENDGNSLTHTDVINIFARRYNPFAKYKTVLYEQGKESKYFKKLSKMIDDDTFCVCCSYGAGISNGKPIIGTGKEIKERYLTVLKQNNLNAYSFMNKLSKMALKRRVLMASGNSTKNEINGFLLNRVEGVGGLDYSRCKVHPESSSRNSMFTQHYELYEFPLRATDDGIALTGLKGTDYPLKSNAPYGTHLATLTGTSLSAPIRAAKLALNEMMESIV